MNNGSHWVGCWEARGHHDCAIRYVRELLIERRTEEFLSEALRALGKVWTQRQLDEILFDQDNP